VASINSGVSGCAVVIINYPFPDLYADIALRRLEALLYLASFRLALNIVYSLRDLSKTVAGSDQKVKGFKGIKA
jgi:hypothetical protein